MNSHWAGRTWRGTPVCGLSSPTARAERAAHAWVWPAPWQPRVALSTIPGLSDVGPGGVGCDSGGRASVMCQDSVRPGTDQPGCQSWATGVSSYTETWLLGGPGNATPRSRGSDSSWTSLRVREASEVGPQGPPFGLRGELCRGRGRHREGGETGRGGWNTAPRVWFRGECARPETGKYSQVCSEGEGKGLGPEPGPFSPTGIGCRDITLPAEGRMRPVGLLVLHQAPHARVLPARLLPQLPRPRPRCPRKAAQAQAQTRGRKALRAAQEQGTKGARKMLHIHSSTVLDRDTQRRGEIHGDTKPRSQTQTDTTAPHPRKKTPKL